MILFSKRSGCEVNVGEVIDTRDWGDVTIDHIDRAAQKVTIRFKSGRTAQHVPNSIQCEFRHGIEKKVHFVSVPLAIAVGQHEEVPEILKEIFAGVKHESLIDFGIHAAGLNTNQTVEQYKEEQS